MALQTAIVPFVVHAGTTDQNVPGFTDENGNDFQPELVLFQSCFAVINTITAGAIPIGGFSDFRGIDTGSARSLWANSDAYSPFNFKAADTGQSLGNHSIMDIWTDNFGQGEIYRTAKIKAMHVGSIDIQYDTNARDGDTIIAIGLAGVDFTFTNYITGTYTTPSKPQGLLSIPCPSPSASGGTSWGTGGQTVPFGFATSDGVYGVANITVVNQGNNFSVQLTDTFNVNIDQTTGAKSTGNPTVAAWNSLSIQISNTGGVGGLVPCIFSGDLIRCAGGAITAGADSFDTGIWAKIVFFFSIGYAASTSVRTASGQIARGWAVKNSQAGFWSGEKTNGNTPPQYGARYLSNSKAINLTSNINGSSTTFDTVGHVASISPYGLVDMTWDSLSGNNEQILWFAIGIEKLPNPATTGAGIYKMITDRLNDKLYLDFSTGDAALFKIPDPNAYTALIGDE